MLYSNGFNIPPIITRMLSISASAMSETAFVTQSHDHLKSEQAAYYGSTKTSGGQSQMLSIRNNSRLTDTDTIIRGDR